MILIESTIKFPYSKKLIKAWLIEALDLFGFKLKKISINIVSQKKMLSLNSSYLNHSDDTDVISFSYTTKSKVSGEIFISDYMLELNAKKYRQTIDNEMLRLISHGVIHLMGHNDKSTKEKKFVIKLEDKFVSLFHVKHIKNV